MGPSGEHSLSAPRVELQMFHFRLRGILFVFKQRHRYWRRHLRDEEPPCRRIFHQKRKPVEVITDSKQFGLDQ